MVDSSEPPLDPTSERIPLETVLAELTATARSAFKRRIRYPNLELVPSHFRHWIDNLYAESRLSRSTWTTLVDAILQLDDEISIAEVFAASVQVFRERLEGAILTGPEAEIPHHRCLGKVMPRLVLERYFRDRAFEVPSRNKDDLRYGFRQLGLGGGRKEAHRFLTALTKGEVFDVPEMLQHIPLHQHLMWSTFDEAGNPFTSLPLNRRTLGCILGLLGGNVELVLLMYTLPDDRTPHVPTIAEAYAGGSWEVLFQPAHPGATFGQTIPRPECGNELTRPEVVHRPVTLRDLNVRPRTL